jgi:hypothetical protein
MRASSGDGAGGAGGVGGARDDAPRPQPLRVLAIWYDLTCITQSYHGESEDISNWCYSNLEIGLGVIFLYSSINRHYSIRGIGSVLG